MRLLVYTAVFGGYDRVFPPLHPEPGIDYVIVTDDAALTVPGWRTHVIAPGAQGVAKTANLQFKALMHRELPGYDASLYIDGNIRLIGRTSEVFTRFLAGGAALGVYRHPLRDTVAAEVEACIAAGKADPVKLRAELAAYQADGFLDDQGLIEATILLKNHRAPALDPAMGLWRDLFQTYQTRDQISLPVVVWKTGLPLAFHEGSFRDPNPWFGLYPHRGAAHVPALYADLSARAYDSRAHRLLLLAWRGSWALRRAARKLRTGRAG